MNGEKTKAIWLGSKKGRGVELLPEVKLYWLNPEEKFNVLGITFAMSEVD